MAMEKVDHMKEALAARRGKGLEHITMDHSGKVEGTDLGEHEDLSARGSSPYAPGQRVARTPEIGPVGSPHKEDVAEGSMSEADFKRSDLAPPSESHESGDKSVMESGMGQHRAVQKGVIGAQHEMAPGDVHTNDDTHSHLMGNLTEVDLRDMANRKPRSLMERARQDAYRGKK